MPEYEIQGFDLPPRTEVSIAVAFAAAETEFGEQHAGPWTCIDCGRRFDSSDAAQLHQDRQAAEHTRWQRLRRTLSIAWHTV